MDLSAMAERRNDVHTATVLVQQSIALVQYSRTRYAERWPFIANRDERIVTLRANESGDVTAPVHNSITEQLADDDFRIAQIKLSRCGFSEVCDHFFAHA